MEDFKNFFFFIVKKNSFTVHFPGEKHRVPLLSFKNRHCFQSYRSIETLVRPRDPPRLIDLWRGMNGTLDLEIKVVQPFHYVIELIINSLFF